MSGKGEMRLQPEKFLGQLPLVWTGELDHGDLAVVVADPRRHAAEEREGSCVALVEGLGAFPREEAAETRVAVRQRQHEQRGLVSHPRDDHLGAAEVHLALARGMEQRYKDLGLRLLVAANGVANNARAPRVALLIAQTLIDTSGRVPLLWRGVAIVVDNLLKNRQ